MSKKKNRNPWWYACVKPILTVVFTLFHPYRVIGRENMPLSGRTIVCSNHVTYGDPVYLGFALRGRQLHFMAKAELFKNKFAAWLLRGLGAFPVARGTGGAEGIQTAMHLIENEQVVCMFPEGTRSKTGEPLHPKTGIAMLAAHTKCTVVPVAIVGADGKPPKIFKRMVINIGEPVPFEEMGITEESTRQYRNAAKALFERVRALREEGLDILQNRWKSV